MSYLVDQYHTETVASAPVSERVRFIRRTYAHLAGAILAFGGLTAAVFLSGKDFSFLGPILWVLALIALGVVIAAAIGVLSLGFWFAVAMVALFCGFIVYDTSNVLHHYGTDQHVSAALE